MVPVVQLVRASDCGSECRGFESHRAPGKMETKRSPFFRVPGGTPVPSFISLTRKVAFQAISLGVSLAPIRFNLRCFWGARWDSNLPVFGFRIPSLILMIRWIGWLLVCLGLI